MTYAKQTWHDFPATDTPADAERLGHMEDGIGAAHDAVALAETAAHASATYLPITAASPIWSGLGMNMGSNLNFTTAYPTAQVTADLAFLKASGFTSIRVALSDYADAGGITNTQALALAAKAAGFSVTYGVACAGTLTSVNMPGAYQTAVYAQAAWAKANGIDEFQVGNEMENHRDGTLTDQQVRTWVRAAATYIKGTVGFTGKVSYAVGQGFSNKSAGWVSDPGLGGLDYLGINVYGDDFLNSNSNFEYYIDQLLTVYTTAQLYVSEFNIYYTWSVITLSQQEIFDQVGQRFAAIKSRVLRANFFCWRYASDYFSAKRTDGTMAPFWPILTGAIPWAAPSTPRRKTFGIDGITTGTNNALTANTMYVGQTFISDPCLLTGVSFYNGGTINGNVIVALYDKAGTLVASSASTAQAGSFGVQRVAFSSTYLAAGGIYYLAVIPSSSTATFALTCAQCPSAGLAQGGFSVPGTITPPAAYGAYIIQSRLY
jgi:hypothetical protein